MNLIPLATVERPGAATPNGRASDALLAFSANDEVGALPWYVVLAKVRQEQPASDNLVRQGYAVYPPRLKILKRLRGRQEAKLEPLFQRHRLVQPGSAAHSIAPVRSTLGVTGVVHFGQPPDILREFESEQNAVPDAAISPIQCGRRVRVAEGLLQRMEGLVSNVVQECVVVLMHLLGQDTRVSLRAPQLQLVS